MDLSWWRNVRRGATLRSRGAGLLISRLLVRFQQGALLFSRHFSPYLPTPSPPAPTRLLSTEDKRCQTWTIGWHHAAPVGAPKTTSTLAFRRHLLPVKGGSILTVCALLVDDSKTFMFDPESVRFGGMTQPRKRVVPGASRSPRCDPRPQHGYRSAS